MAVPLRAAALAACLAVGSALVVPLSASRPADSLQGVRLPRAGGGGHVDLGEALASSAGKTLLVLGTYPADFNMVEYMQRVRVFLPDLRAKGVTRCMMVVNGPPAACEKLASLLDLPDAVELYADPAGEAGRRFGVSRGFRPDDSSLSAFAKLFVMGIVGGPGAWATLPAVLVGYFGSPGGKRRWIEESLKQGQLAGRWPDSVLQLADEEVVANAFDDTPLVSSWGVRPFELATLRLQNLVSLQAKHWGALKPADERCLTQLGGCTVVGSGGECLYSWVDRGLCDVVDFESMLESL